MNREQKVAKARELSVAGVSLSEIAAHLGVTHSCVYKWLHPEKTREWNRRENATGAERKRRSADAHRAPCPECGQPTRLGSTWAGHGVTRCMDCTRADAERKRQQIIDGYERGLTSWEIAEQTGIPRNTVVSEAHRLRVAGRLTAKAPLGAKAHRRAA